MPARKFDSASHRCLSKSGRLRCEGRQGHLGPHENDGVRWMDLVTDYDNVETGGKL